MTFYFYDLETSSINPRTGRIMQFAGQRTDENFNVIGEPFECLVKLSDEVLPSPGAVLVHGVTPQKAAEEGYTEAEFLKRFNDEVLQPNTVILGYNTIRFDDEFMRYTLWRNFYDPYEWQWQDGRSRWDIIDVVRMTRGLRPDGIEWPFDEETGLATNKLEELTKANDISHEDAHDALSDVIATIEMAKLLKSKQPKIFDFLLQHRGKRDVAKLLDVKNPQPVVHTSGMFSNEWHKTSVVIPIAPHPTNPSAVLVYDLRYNPEDFANLSIEELRHRAFTPLVELEKGGLKRLPVKAIHMNKAPAVAPLGVLDEKTQKRIKLPMKRIEAHKLKLTQPKGFADRIYKAMHDDREFGGGDDPDQQLYDGFVPDQDKEILRQVRNRDASLLRDYTPDFKDKRLPSLYIRYKGRNFPSSLSESELEAWRNYVARRHAGEIDGALGIEAFGAELFEQSQRTDLSSEHEFLLQELQLYGEGLLNL